MADIENNLNLINYSQSGVNDLNNNPNNTNMILRQKEAIIQVPMDNVQKFINNGIQKILMQEHKINNNAAQAAYEASIKKSSELVKGLSDLLLDAFNNVNTNLDYLNNKMLEMEKNINEYSKACGQLWDKQEQISKKNIEIENNNLKSEEKLESCINSCNNSKKMIENNNNKMAERIKSIDAELGKIGNNNIVISNNINKQSKKLETIEKNINEFNNISKKIKSPNNEINDLKKK